MTQINEKRRLSTDKLGKNLTGSILKYPHDLEDANGHYMIFNVFSRTKSTQFSPNMDLNIHNPNEMSNAGGESYNDTFTNERFFDETTAGIGVPKRLIRDSIVLYMPDNVKVDYVSNYDAAEVGMLTGVLASFADIMKGKQGWGDAGKGLGAQTSKLVESLLDFGSLGTAAGAAAKLQRTTGIAPAPMQEMIFKGIDYRKYDYSFKMTPRNRKEAREVNDIVDTFTYHMLPEKLGQGSALAFRVPSEFSIRYMYRGMENNYLNQIALSALTNMTVSYGGEEKFATYRKDEHGAPPVTTNVTLSFQELEFVDRQLATFGTHDIRGRNKSTRTPDKVESVPPVAHNTWGDGGA